MSLSPQDYQRAIGTATIETGSCLVFLDRIVGEHPCGCDGWQLAIEDDFVVDQHGLLFPPDPWGSNYIGVAQATANSRKLAAEVKHIRKQWRKNELERIY